MIHAVTMGLLLAGMFGLSMAAMELSKETKVGAEGALVSQKGDAVLVGSSDMRIVTGADGSPELRQRASSDGRRLDESDDGLITVGTPLPAVLDLTDEDDAIDDGSGRRLAMYDPGQKYKVYTRLNYNKAKRFFKDLAKSRNANEFTLMLPGADFNGQILRKSRIADSEPLSFVALLSGRTAEVVYVRCLDRNNGRQRCAVYFKKTEGQPFLLDDGDAMCMKHGQCKTREWVKVEWSAEAELDWSGEAGHGDVDEQFLADDSHTSWAELGFDGGR